MPKREFVKSDFLEWSGKSKKHVLTANPKSAVKFLRGVNSDYRKLDLRRKIHPNTIRKIERDTRNFFEYIDRPIAQIIRPRKKNRKLYSEIAQQPGSWTVYAVPRQSADSVIKLKKHKRTRAIIETTKHVTYTKLYFDKKKLAYNAEREVKRLASQVKNIKHIRIIVGPYMIGAEFLDLEQVIREIKKLMAEYVSAKKKSDNQSWDNWLDGLEFATFKNQTGMAKNGKTKRRRKSRREKIRGRR